MRKGLARTALILALGGLCLAPNAFARIAFNTIDPVATFFDAGERIVLTGPIACDRRQRVEVRVTLTQRSSGAVAEGYAQFVCTGELQQWEVQAAVQGRAAFEPGSAIAVALGASLDRGQPDDAHQWLVPITLVEE